MTSHIDTTLRFNKHHTTEAGIPFLVDDYETPSDWWDQHEGVRSSATSSEPGSIMLVASIDPDEPAACIEEFEAVREPDFFDEGFAYWLTPDAVVYVDVNRIDQVTDVLATADRLRWHTVGCGFDRIHPSHYGIQVEWFNGSAHSAHESWKFIEEVTR